MVCWHALRVASWMRPLDVRITLLFPLSFVLGWRQLISWLYFTGMNNRSHVSIFSHRDTQRNVSLNLWLDVCRGASVDIASVEVPQSTSYQSKFMAVLCMKEQKVKDDVSNTSHNDKT